MADFEQPGGGWIGSLTHVVIHGLDATLPLGLGRPFSDEATRSVLDALVEPGERSLFGVELKGMALHATDLEWRHGGTDAPVSEAAAAELVVVLAGRTVPS